MTDHQPETGVALTGCGDLIRQAVQDRRKVGVGTGFLGDQRPAKLEEDQQAPSFRKYRCSVSIIPMILRDFQGIPYPVKFKN